MKIKKKIKFKIKTNFLTFKYKIWEIKKSKL